jgi:hypothetical protein
LTEYYLWLSFGGVLGGMFNGLFAPMVFPAAWEYPLALALAVVFVPQWRAPRWPRLARGLDIAVPVAVGLLAIGFALFEGQQSYLSVPRFRFQFVNDVLGFFVRQQRNLALLVQEMIESSGQAIPILACLAALLRPHRLGLCLAIVFGVNALVPPAGVQRLDQERTFFGIIRVEHDELWNYNHFFHGKTDHGAQCLDSEKARRIPRTYFYPTGPVGQIFAAFDGPNAKKRVAVVGLGAGTLASYGKPGQQFTFFEIDSAVERVARRYFTYLADCRAEQRHVLGDARLTLAQEPPSSYGMIFLDAFTSDALPVHLITREAMQMYLEKLEPGGIVIVDISNRYVDLESVVAAVARDCGLHGLVSSNENISSEEREEGMYPSSWVVLARDPADFRSLTKSDKWRSFQPRRSIRGWSDDYSNILSVLEIED